MLKNHCSICEIDLEESYGVILSLAVIDKHGQHEILPDKDPTQILCEKCWEHKEKEINKLFKVL